MSSIRRSIGSFGPFCVALLACVSLLYASSPSPSDQASLLPIVQRLRIEYPTPMAPEQVGELMTRTAATAGPEWGVLLKPHGNNCQSPVGLISCDILVHIPTEQEYDLLADSEGRGEPVFEKLPFQCGRATSGCDMARVRAVTSVPPTPTPTPTPVPTPTPTPQPPPPPPPDPRIGELLERLAVLEVEIARLNLVVVQPREIEIKGGWRVGTMKGTLLPPK